MNMPVKSLNKHRNCQTVIRWRQFRDRPESTPGLYCAKHNKLIMWLNIDTARELIKNGVKEE